MPAEVKREECVSCGTCVEECPEEAITLDEEEIAKLTQRNAQNAENVLKPAHLKPLRLDKWKDLL